MSAMYRGATMKTVGCGIHRDIDVTLADLKDCVERRIGLPDSGTLELGLKDSK